MMLLVMMLVLVIGGVAAWLAARWSALGARLLALGATAIVLALTLIMWAQGPGDVLHDTSGWYDVLALPWVPQFGISILLAADGLGLLFVTLTAVLGLVAVLAGWRTVTARVGAFHLLLLLALAGMVGVFVALDLFLFYVFWELMLIPIFFLMIIWGTSRRAAIKFFLFTQVGSLLMLLAILGLAFLHWEQTGAFTFDYFALFAVDLQGVGAWLLLGFALAFLVKLAIVPLHPWQPDAYAAAPTPALVLLAGVMLKAGGYGLIRFALPLFPAEAARFADVAIVLGVISILYGAVLAFAQTDLKRLIAYSSISHMGFVLIGVATAATPALPLLSAGLLGAVVVMLAHGLSTGGLFIAAGIIEERLGTRDLRALGGLWAAAPRLAGAALVLALATLGLPGLGNFVGEFLVLSRLYASHPALVLAVAVGLVLAAAYALRLFTGVFYGPRPADTPVRDLRPREILIFTVLIAGLLWSGLSPMPLLRAADSAVRFVITLDHSPGNFPTRLRSAQPVLPADRRLGLPPRDERPFLEGGLR